VIRPDRNRIHNTAFSKGFLYFENTLTDLPVPTVLGEKSMGLQNPDPDPLVRGMDPDPALDPDPDPSSIMQK
jgi:hypothetical protein